jgi:hypothetical protein
MHRVAADGVIEPRVHYQRIHNHQLLIVSGAAAAALSTLFEDLHQKLFDFHATFSIKNGRITNKK